ncbi:MAG: hypothetical protein AAF558_04765 [Verrucomicrobiota bacterium]
MKWIKLVSLASLVVGFAGIVNESNGQNSVPPPPRPFQVDTGSGSTSAGSTVAPGSSKSSVFTNATGTAPTTEGVQPRFLASGAPRPEKKTGYYVGAMAGLNLDSFGNGFTGNPAIFGGADSNMTLGPMASLKFGYIWPFDNEPIDQFKDETGGLRLAGALEAEFLYFHGFHEVGPSAAETEVEQITIAPMLNALLKGSFGRSVIYVGGGVGLAFNFFDSDNEPVLRDQEELADFAWQAIVGYEFHLDTDWALFVEGKYFGMQNLQYVSQGDQANALVGFGVKRQL